MRMFFQKLIQSLSRNKVSYAVVGGYALALHGAVRGTVDIDLVISLKLKDYVAFESVMTKLGLISKIPVDAKQLFQFREEYIQNKNLIAWSFVNPHNPTEIVDVIITEDLAKLKTVKKKVSFGTIHLVAIDDLIRMKRESGRKQDLEDIQALEKLK